ncbi:hypothetical protein H257_13176 [Aphanomyces astaci]|uniref:Uncharacterized protein n=1 Tax=Aphanomyces astaci TaxID=112090 RepID=W4FXX4_APHAT|nr:hypothetical protein H257_13176 [Aphanomyces astaci]ETV71513.1 hypothetical protein H257_13176 [Aphanomyces astaci]|eukprot:XP_009838946.1 hypothetical protein H257_13176 [Aphanomyces astaci]
MSPRLTRVASAARKSTVNKFYVHSVDPVPSQSIHSLRIGSFNSRSLPPNLHSRLESYWAHTYRIAIPQVNLSRHQRLNVITAYAPHMDHPRYEAHDFYDSFRTAFPPHPRTLPTAGTIPNGHRTCSTYANSSKANIASL